MDRNDGLEPHDMSGKITKLLRDIGKYVILKIPGQYEWNCDLFGKYGIDVRTADLATDTTCEIVAIWRRSY